jgi:hypothetical protein
MFHILVSALLSVCGLFVALLVALVGLRRRLCPGPVLRESGLVRCLCAMRLHRLLCHNTIATCATRNACHFHYHHQQQQQQQQKQQ